MTDYVLKVQSWGGMVPGAKHYRGRVEGPWPKSCHGGTIWSDRGQTCAEGHSLPKRIEWDVDASWTAEHWNRYIALPFDSREDGPGQFLDLKTLIDTAIGRFLGQLPVNGGEEEGEVGQPGDRLYYHWLPQMVLPESFTDEERERRDGLPLPGDLLAEAGKPPVKEPRSYRIYPTWHIMCSQCNEDIVEGNADTRNEAVGHRDDHDRWHQADEAAGRTAKARRTYHVYAEWHVTCSECNEDITEGRVHARLIAGRHRDSHEAWHKRDEESTDEVAP